MTTARNNIKWSNSCPSKFVSFAEKDVNLVPMHARYFHNIVVLLLYTLSQCRTDIHTLLTFYVPGFWSIGQWEVNQASSSIYLWHQKWCVHIWSKWYGHSKVYIDHTVNADVNSHASGVISWGAAALFTKSKKQICNAKSSTKAKIVGVSNYILNVIWSQMLFECHVQIMTISVSI